MKPEDKLLIVEDNPTIAAAFERAGQQLNLEVEVATDGWDAIEKLRTDQFAGVVVDTDLPRHSGFGVLTYLRQENGEAFDNVIVMTSGDRNVIRERVSGSLQVIEKSEEIDADSLARLFSE